MFTTFKLKQFIIEIIHGIDISQAAVDIIENYGEKLLFPAIEIVDAKLIRVKINVSCEIPLSKNSVQYDGSNSGRMSPGREGTVFGSNSETAVVREVVEARKYFKGI